MKTGRGIEQTPSGSATAFGRSKARTIHNDFSNFTAIIQPYPFVKKKSFRFIAMGYEAVAAAEKIGEK